jgi:hypothetical protein
MAERELDPNDLELSRTIGRRVGACLRHWQKARGAVLSMRRPGQVYLWEIVPMTTRFASVSRFWVCDEDSFWNRESFHCAIKLLILVVFCIFISKKICVVYANHLDQDSLDKAINGQWRKYGPYYPADCG